LSGLISQDVVAQVKGAADIVDIVSRYLALKKSGRNFKALCPFHTEKTPSFMVSPERQLFRCFGCGKAGDVFTFVAEHERVSFPEAVRIVASAVGISIPETWGKGRRTDSKLKSRLYELHKWATTFFVRQLRETPGGATARDYLAARHFDKATLEAWSIGYAPDSWDALGNTAHRAGYSDQELLAAGLAISRQDGKGHYDRFRHRVVFPIRDLQGRVIAFGARALGDSEVKYLNSPETPLFNKGRGLYGLDKARDAIVDAHRVIVTEGYTDTLMCHQQGVTTAVATLGTALTRDHVRLLRRYAEQAVLVFDADAAGESAVDRSLDVFADEDVDARVAATDEGSDPCDFLVAEGPQAFLERVDAARELFAVKLDLVCRKHNVETSDGMARAIDEVLAAVAQVSNPTKADLLTQVVAKRMGVAAEAVRRRLGRLRKTRRTRQAEQPADAQPPIDPVERGVLCAVLARGELARSVLARVALDDFHDARVRRVVEQAIELYDREGEIDHAELTAALQDNSLAALVAEIATSELERGNWEEWLQGCLDRMEQRKRRGELHQLKEQAARTPQAYDRDALAAIFEHHRRRAGRIEADADDRRG